MTTSATTNYNATRDQIITRALRIAGAIGQGETPNAVMISEASQALNDLVKEYETDGLQLWCITTYTLTPVAGTKDYNVGIGQAVAQEAPKKIIQAWVRNTASDYDSPVRLLSRADYNMLGNKESPGTTNQMMYDPPRAIQAGGEQYGTVTLFPVPDATMVAAATVMFVGVKSLDDFDASTDTLDFPTHWINTLVWGLADQLAYEYGVGLSERAMITKKAQTHKINAMSYDTEEGSIYLQPTPTWTWELRR